MSSFLRSIRDGKSFSEEQRLEAEYQKLFKKIARDFVTREDLDVILSDFVELLFETNEEFEESFEENPIDFSRKEKALSLAKEYSANLKIPTFARKQYKDII
jgi:hypothetical protein